MSLSDRINYGKYNFYKNIKDYNYVLEKIDKYVSSKYKLSENELEDIGVKIHKVLNIICESRGGIINSLDFTLDMAIDTYKQLVKETPITISSTELVKMYYAINN